VNLKEFEYEILENRIFVRQFENLSPDLVIVRGVFRSIKSITAYLESLRRKGVKIFDNQFLLHKYSINKISDIIKLVQAGIPVPDTFHLHSFEKYLPSAAKVGYPIVCKLTRTGKGAGVHKFDREEDFKRFIENIALNEGDPRNYIIQKFIPYVYDLRILVIASLTREAGTSTWSLLARLALRTRVSMSAMGSVTGMIQDSRGSVSLGVGVLMEALTSWPWSRRALGPCWRGSGSTGGTCRSGAGRRASGRTGGSGCSRAP